MKVFDKGIDQTSGEVRPHTLQDLSRTGRQISSKEYALL